MIKTGATGSVIKGHVLDCAVGPLTERLKDYDQFLYVAWNPKKIRGWGCWEVRRAPEEKCVRDSDVCIFGGNTIVFPKYHETPLVHHVMDVPYLNYKILEKLKKIDMWSQKDTGYRGKNLTAALDYNEAKFMEKADEKSSKELEYNLKQHKREIQYFKDYVASGHNPYRLADYWGKS